MATYCKEFGWSGTIEGKDFKDNYRSTSWELGDPIERTYDITKIEIEFVMQVYGSSGSLEPWQCAKVFTISAGITGSTLRFPDGGTPTKHSCGQGVYCSHSVVKTSIDMRPGSDTAELAKKILSSENEAGTLNLYFHFGQSSLNTGSSYPKVLQINIKVYYADPAGVKVYDSGEWKSYVVNRYDGEKWVVCSVETYDGTKWIPCSG